MKKILFVIDSLNIGGAEKSLISLLNNIDYNRYDVDLQLFGYGGGFEKFLPKQVHLLPPLQLSRFLDKGIWDQIKCLDGKIAARLFYSLKIRLKQTNHTDKARIYWQCFNKFIEENPCKYDVAIAYAHNIPTFYVAEKIKAKKKMAWINAEIHFSSRNRNFQRPFYSQYNKIVLVSEKVRQVIKEQYPEYEGRMIIIKDIVDADFIVKLSSQCIEESIDESRPCLLTVARLERFHKGYDIAMEACNILKERGVKFVWYVIGDGEYRGSMVDYITNHSLNDTFVLLGKKSNPYPYFKKARIYVQTSRREGFGLSIAEARLLNCPVITTEFGAVWNQMEQGKNGLVVAQNPVAVADAVERLLHDKQLYDSISDYLKHEKKGNVEEILKFYELVEQN